VPQIEPDLCAVYKLYLLTYLLTRSGLLEPVIPTEPAVWEPCLRRLNETKTRFWFCYRSLLCYFRKCFVCQDLGSTNILELCASLMTSCHMVSAEIIPALLPSVIEKLSHSK